MDVKSTNDALRYLYKLSPNRTNLRFRGQADFDWTVQPSIYRYSGFRRYQTVQFESFLLEYMPPEPEPPLTLTKFELEWLMVSQHYGVPTRLLDWTIDILIALFFACEAKASLDKDGALFVCDLKNYKKFNQYKEPAMESQEFSFVSTNVVNPRMRLQSGCFMLWGHAPLNKSTRESYDLWSYHAAKNRNFFMQKIRIAACDKRNILKELEDIYSINRESVYNLNGFLEREYLQRFQQLKESPLKNPYIH